MTEPGNGNSGIDADSNEDSDIPGIVAVAIAKGPGLVLRSGWIYLMTKRRARKSAKIMARTMENNGVPQDFARRLADKYEEDLSVTRLMRSFGFPFWKEPGK